MEDVSQDIYSFLGSKIEEGRKEIDQPSLFTVILSKIFAWLRTRYPDIIVFLGYVLSIHRLLLNISSCGWCIYYLNGSILPDMNSNIFFGIFIPASAWIFSTCLDFWSFRNRKIFGILLVILSAAVVLETLVLRAATIFILPSLLKMPVNQDISQGMIISLCRGVLFIPVVAMAVGLYFFIIKNMFNRDTVRSIMYFKFNRNMDLRKNKMFCYDMNIVRYLNTGKMHRVYENDRFLHCMSIGTTGTGKTSTCLTVSINSDFDRKVKNEDYQKKKISKLLRSGNVRMLRDFDDADFSSSYFVADTQKYQKKLTKIQEKAMSAGITAMAPNEKFSDELYELSKSKSLKVNRVDPKLDENGEHKEGFIGFNPLYISPKLEGMERKLEIFTKARVYADVNQAIFEKDESGDPYFTGLNRNFTTSVTVMVLLTYPSMNNGKQPLPDVVQDIINDFEKARPYRDQMIRMFSTKFNRPNNTDPVMDAGKANIGEYQFILDVIDKNFLGKGRDKMQDQAQGLQNIINETLSNPLIRQVLCAENSIDIDRMLDKGEITFVNYAIELGSAGTAFGMFYLLSFINAVLRRPAGKKLLPHFCYIDELPELLHPDLGRTFALFRQYCVGMFVALQSLDQLDKSPKTKYLKSVIVGGCAHQIVFGRCSTAEMELYQSFGGTREEIFVSHGITETALSLENTSKSMSTRETKEIVNNVEGVEMRYRDFREVTMFTVTKGSPVMPFYGKTFFLEDIKKIKLRRFVFNWSNFFKPVPGFKENVVSLKDNAQLQSSTSMENYEKHAGNTPKSITFSEVTQEKNATTSLEEQEESVIAQRIFLSAGESLPDNQENILAEEIAIADEQQEEEVIGITMD